MPFNQESRAQLASHDKHWLWKVALRLLLVLVDLVAIGLIAWATATGLKQYGDTYDIWDTDVIPYDFIPLGASLIWCTIVILVQLLRKIPVHPGVEVGLDLVVWLVFAILAAFTIFAAVDLVQYNSYSIDGSDSDSGYTTTAANGSIVYVAPSNGDDCPRFQSCADQSAFLDSVTHRGVIEIAAGSLMILALILHFTHFVWGCVDTAARNASKTHRQAKEIADAMIAEMVARGQLPAPQQPLLMASQRGSQAISEPISRENSAAYMTPAGGYHTPQAQTSGQAQAQAQAQMQMTSSAQQAVLATAMAHGQPRARSASPGASLTAPQTQPARSEGGSSQNGNGNGNGWHTPPTQHPSEASKGVANSTAQADDPDAIRPVPPVRAPGHTYSPTGSISQQGSFANLR